jgi:hypothetical protein
MHRCRVMNDVALPVGKMSPVLKVLGTNPIIVRAGVYRIEQACLYFSRVASTLTSLHS